MLLFPTSLLVRGVLGLFFVRLLRAAALFELDPFACVLESVVTSPDRGLARLYLADGLLNSLVDLLLNLVDGASSIQFGLNDFVRLQEVL